jgi:ADP-ribose pyrophosphatase
VAILPVWNDHVLLLKNFRHAIRDWRMEISRGFAEPGQTPEENAHRELLEEVGGAITDLVPLGGPEADSGITNDRTDLFLAHLERHGMGAIDEGIAAIAAVSFAELERMIRDNEIADSFTISAYARPAETVDLILSKTPNGCHLMGAQAKQAAPIVVVREFFGRRLRLICE